MAITWTLVDVLEQTDHFDKDERYMAINDLKEELQRDARIDSAMEKRVCDAVLSRLEKDTCNDVRAMAVQWWVCMRGCGERVPTVAPPRAPPPHSAEKLRVGE